MWVNLKKTVDLFTFTLEACNKKTFCEQYLTYTENTRGVGMAFLIFYKHVIFNFILKSTGFKLTSFHSIEQKTSELRWENWFSK